MLAAPMMSSLALLWVAIEVTTVISALLVAIEDTDGAAEAAWKYVLLASAGLGLALLATIFAYYAGAQVLGQSYDLAFTPLLAVAARLPHAAVQLAFVLAVLGFGTKMGLFPVHTWLPDAHSEAPTPVSALLSGSLLAVSFYAILRFYQVAEATLGPRFPRNVLLVFGVASLLLAALYLFGQRDIKRLLAYSSVEHMGILAIGVSFGAPIALAAFCCTSWRMPRRRATRSWAPECSCASSDPSASPRSAGVSTCCRGAARCSWSRSSRSARCRRSGCSVASSRSSRAGSGSYVAAAILIIAVTAAFFGLAVSTTRMLMQPAPEEVRPKAVKRAVGAGAAAAGRPDCCRTPGCNGAWCRRASRAPGWSCRSWRARWRCCCSACARPRSSLTCSTGPSALLGGTAS